VAPVVIEGDCRAVLAVIGRASEEKPQALL